MPKLLRVLTLLLAISLVAAACGGDDSGDGFSSSTRDAYLSGCVEDGNEEFCDCTLEELEKVFTESEFEDFALNAAASGLEEPPAEFMNAILACADKIDLGG